MNIVIRIVLLLFMIHGFAHILINLINTYALIEPNFTIWLLAEIASCLMIMLLLLKGNEKGKCSEQDI